MGGAYSVVAGSNGFSKWIGVFAHCFRHGQRIRLLVGLLSDHLWTALDVLRLRGLPCLEAELASTTR